MQRAGEQIGAKWIFTFTHIRIAVQQRNDDIQPAKILLVGVTHAHYQTIHFDLTIDCFIVDQRKPIGRHVVQTRAQVGVHGLHCAFQVVSIEHLDTFSKVLAIGMQKMLRATQCLVVRRSLCCRYCMFDGVGGISHDTLHEHRKSE